ncbi:[FeFe] hydrogenase H-cluster maturation GTPase HydF [Bacteroides sp. ET336]|uniref:[FeFe] hydrogenase H-cluster maturation GTPase HydF n=1 Tax=Bacteroides sp. ET336 TaxID=2972459 RepID=UPI0021AC7258|nr:[FeFe] hydrogenase H-cluster maturation GTPase HydF [Bacteroides sp. ET336]MCR8893848.1 [FeFe] hydrogenase H-cluster maturation GTPase HydF [Bacteroides sp. ET336]MDN0058345.1 [FeFe] hydrogenase H-cluster maturation GTPase HydF [Bacteroides caecigallinarum]
MSLQDTPRSNRTHIALFGKRNSGKSSLINAITGQEVSVVSDVAGTTTDPVYKSMEIHGIGPCVFIDTAGFDDEGELGNLRVKQTLKATERTDIAIMVCTDDNIEEELRWQKVFTAKNTPVIWVLNKADNLDNKTETALAIEKKCGTKPVIASTLTKEGIDEIRKALIENQPDNSSDNSIIGNLAGENDTVLLVMPQDIQAPKGRLILPQVQTLRELLDKKCLVMSCTTDKLEAMLKAMVNPPKLIITDSQVFKTVFELKPKESILTSFSVLFAKHKGDIDFFVEGARTIGKLNNNSKVLIAEACTHAPLTEDIGREKIPAMLRKRFGNDIHIDIVSGHDFPENLDGYDLIIHCGACMFNRKFMMNRVAKAKEQNIPMTNYGVTIAYIQGILDYIEY